MSDYNQFDKDWRSMTDVAFVGILGHGNPSTLRLYTAYKDGQEDTANHKRINYSQIIQLQATNAGTIFIGSCNTAKNDTKWGEKYVANGFLQISGVNSVVAADGYEYMRVSWPGLGNTRFKADYYKDGTKGDYSAPKGCILLTKNRKKLQMNTTNSLEE